MIGGLSEVYRVCQGSIGGCLGESWGLSGVPWGLSIRSRLETKFGELIWTALQIETSVIIQ